MISSYNKVTCLSSSFNGKPVCIHQESVEHGSAVAPPLEAVALHKQEEELQLFLAVGKQAAVAI